VLFLNQSCGFLIYNYRGKLECNYTIENINNDTTIRYNVGNSIFNLSQNSKLYERYKSKSMDSLYFYGPDYHTIEINIEEKPKTTEIKLKYFGYNGSRKNPPQKTFINSIRDSLINRFGANETIKIQSSNEK
jgi:hypothetical protein